MRKQLKCLGQINITFVVGYNLTHLHTEYSLHSTGSRHR